jgi:hypothetical protein
MICSSVTTLFLLIFFEEVHTICCFGLSFLHYVLYFSLNFFDVLSYDLSKKHTASIIKVINCSIKLLIPVIYIKRDD